MSSDSEEDLDPEILQGAAALRAALGTSSTEDPKVVVPRQKTVGAGDFGKQRTAGTGLAAPDSGEDDEEGDPDIDLALTAMAAGALDLAGLVGSGAEAGSDDPPPDLDGNDDEDGLYEDDVDLDDILAGLRFDAAASSSGLGSSSFAPLLIPEDAAARALRLNREGQAWLQQALGQVRAGLEHNAMQQKQVQLVIRHADAQRRKGASRAGQSLTTPVVARALANRNMGPGVGGSKFFAAPDGSCPLPNSDTRRQMTIFSKMPLTYNVRRWTKAEDNLLAKSVAGEVKRVLTARLLEAYRSDPRRGGAGEALGESLRARLGEIGEVDLASPEARDAAELISWEHIAARVPGRGRGDCKVRWLNHVHPNVNTDPWTKEEDKRLLVLANRERGCNWEVVASELGGGRRPAACLARFQRSLNKQLVRSEWSGEEDSLLRATVARVGEGSWTEVAEAMPGRTPAQCMHRWQKCIKAGIRRGKWSEEEDRALSQAVAAYGSKNSWVRIAQHVEGRTDIQCRERWCNVLDPTLKRGVSWSAGEDARLRAAVEAAGGAGNWSKVAAVMGDRTDNQCWRRWKVIEKEQVREQRKEKKIRRVALVTNYVGREKERTKLSPEDLKSVMVPEELARLEGPEAPARVPGGRPRGAGRELQASRRGRGGRGRARGVSRGLGAPEEAGASNEDEEGGEGDGGEGLELAEVGRQEVMLAICAPPPPSTTRAAARPAARGGGRGGRGGRGAGVARGSGQRGAAGGGGGGSGAKEGAVAAGTEQRGKKRSAPTTPTPAPQTAAKGGRRKARSAPASAPDPPAADGRQGSGRGAAADTARALSAGAAAGAAAARRGRRPPPSPSPNGRGAKRKAGGHGGSADADAPPAPPPLTSRSKRAIVTPARLTD